MLSDNDSSAQEKRPVAANREALLRDLYSLSGREILDTLLSTESAKRFLQEFAPEDFLWMVKKIGEEDSLPVLRMGSEQQWSYLVDLEVWRRDRVQTGRLARWLELLLKANPKRLIRWIYGEAEPLACFFFLKHLRVVIKEDEDAPPPQGFFTLDGVYYLKVDPPEYREFVEALLKEMAAEDMERYQTIMLELQGLLPSQVEEEMYRLRNVRLAEHGFLPFEEALSIYAPLDPGRLKEGPLSLPPEISLDKEERAAVPVSPVCHIEGENMLAEALSGMGDPQLLDRIRLDFARLCNQIISADGIVVDDLDVLVRVSRKAAGYLNLALEAICGKDAYAAERILKDHYLVEIFRAGIALVMELSREAKAWLKKSWFHGRGLPLGFWGEPWGGVLEGLLFKRPKFYVGLGEGDPYRDFERLAELEEARRLLWRLVALDRLLDGISKRCPADDNFPSPVEELTFRPLLFNPWARRILGLQPSFEPVSLEEARRLFRILREGEGGPPYRMPGFGQRFIEDMADWFPDCSAERLSILRETLELVWQEFQQEYEDVAVENLSARYGRFLKIRSAFS